MADRMWVTSLMADLPQRSLAGEMTAVYPLAAASSNKPQDFLGEGADAQPAGVAGEGRGGVDYQKVGRQAERIYQWRLQTRPGREGACGRGRSITACRN